MLGVLVVGVRAPAVAQNAEPRRADREGVIHPRVILSQPRFDGRELTGTLIACADLGAVFLDRKLPVFLETVTAPSGQRLRYTVFDTMTDATPDLMVLEQSYCFGRQVSFRLFAQPAASYSGCLVAELSVRAYSKGAKTGEKVSVLVNVCSP